MKSIEQQLHELRNHLRWGLKVRPPEGASAAKIERIANYIEFCENTLEELAMKFPPWTEDISLSELVSKPLRKKPNPNAVRAVAPVLPPWGTYGRWDYPNKIWAERPAEADIPDLCRQKAMRDPKSNLWSSEEATRQWLRGKGLLQFEPK